MGDKSLSNEEGSVKVREPNEVGILSESINNDRNGSVPVGRRQALNEIHGNALLYLGRDR